ncbi:MAG TPA: hypothetical protein VGR57_03705 [Ktedonobacterales bacterium]|nr:hypothetical protein [Ktedonobacterales bacterium]
MQQRYPAQQPPRQRSRRAPSGAPQAGADPARLMPRPWPGMAPGTISDPPSANPFGSGQRMPGGYPPGAPPPQPRPVRRRTFARIPVTRPPSTPLARTDPTLYQWDRLSPEQQQEVLATIKAANLPRRGAGLLSRGVLLALLVAALALLVGLLLLR